MIPYASQVRFIYKTRQKLDYLPIRNSEWYVMVALAITKAVNHRKTLAIIEAPTGVDVVEAKEHLQGAGYHVSVDEYRVFTISWA